MSKKYRERAMKNAPFPLLDADQDGQLEAADFGKRAKPVHDWMLKNVAKRDDEWIWNQYFQVTSAWLIEHFSLEPNKARLLRLEQPIYVFHGTDDPNVLVEGVHDLKRRFEAVGEENLKAFIFEDHDHI